MSKKYKGFKGSGYNEANNTNIKVHGYMMYECECCGQQVKMYLEKGLEDRIQDKENPQQHKPVPFIIGCNKCGGAMKHVDWNMDKCFGFYLPLPEGGSYFKNTKDGNCGVPVIAKEEATE